MWYEIIPTFAMVTAGLAAPAYGLWWLHYFTLGNHFRRTMDDRWHRASYQRDQRITGNPYVISGLESIPDEK